MDFTLIIAVIGLPYLLAGGIYLARDALRAERQGLILSGAFALAFVFLLAQSPVIQSQGAAAFRLDWMSRIGLAFSLYVDGLALLFALIVTGIASAVFFYAGYYFEDRRKAGHFHALLLTFTGSMLLLVMAGNLLTLFVAWELTSIVSFLLISFKGTDAEARRGASQALIVTGGGGLALLAGLLLAGSAAGSMELSDILTSGEALRQSPLIGAITVLVLLGAFSKSAQFPLHFWLPEAMSAPTPASAFLHSATMVKAGIYLLLRLYPVLGRSDLWAAALTLVGLTTMIVGAILALRQRDLKGILAFSTISQLGAFVALIGQPDSAGLKAALVGLIAHALYKCALFLVVGAVDHASGTRNIDELGGLRHPMRGFAVVALLSGLSMAGVPPLLGFVGKETLLETFTAQPVVLAIVVIGAALTVTLALRLFVDVFLGRPSIPLPQSEHADHDVHHPLGDDAYDYSHFHSLPSLMVAGPGALAVLSIVVGVGVGPLLDPLVGAALGKEIHLHLFPPDGLNLAFVMSMTALALGAVVFTVRGVWLRWRIPTVATGPQVYRWLVSRVERLGDLVLRTQGGKVRHYLSVILISVVLLLIPALASADQLGIRSLNPGIQGAADVLKAILLLLTLGATLASILFGKHLLAALSLGIAGYAVGGIFLLEPAPDVALVQFLVETLITVLIIIILARTSARQRRAAISRVWAQTRRGLGRDLAISIALGVAVTIIALAAVSSRPTLNPIAAWHLQNAYPRLGVNDVVAGIITDFRGTDTLIEITVFGMAALGILTLLARPNPGKTMRLFRRAPEPAEPSPVKDALQEDAEQPETLVYRSHFNDPITRLAAVPLLPVSMMIALAHILYAGAAPGDGFTAGVIMGLGVTIWYVVFGYEQVKARLRWLHPAAFIGLGMLLAFVNAALPLLFGRDFLALTTISGVSIADIKLASSLVFEVGICFAVFGGICAILEAISHPKEVEPV